MPEMDAESITKEALETIAEVMRSADSLETRRKAAIDLLNVHNAKGKGTLGSMPSEDQLERLGHIIRETEAVCEAVRLGHEAVGSSAVACPVEPVLPL